MARRVRRQPVAVAVGLQRDRLIDGIDQEQHGQVLAAARYLLEHQLRRHQRRATRDQHSLR